jgi:hypothetical protein
MGCHNGLDIQRLNRYNCLHHELVNIHELIVMIHEIKVKEKVVICTRST